MTERERVFEESIEEDKIAKDIIDASPKLGCSRCGSKEIMVVAQEYQHEKTYSEIGKCLKCHRDYYREEEWDNLPVGLKEGLF